ncbi:hypothetical protein C5167_025015 [Papaver somniferum]|uniref:Clp R domain-containing protein n=1 Tax=Papaver somniferum TaxID=3469 RepID=A0A4Y7JQ86_PAPSO|nr:hypothetical protein C5167_025015 [Papaver somniferum]
MAGALNLIHSTNIHHASAHGSRDSKQRSYVVTNRTTAFRNGVQMQGLRTSSSPSLVFSGNDFHAKVATYIAAPSGRGSRCVARAMVFERLTEKGIKTIMLAQEEGRRLGHNFVGTEQILLGLIGEGSGIAAKVLKSMGINLKDARVEVEKFIGKGSGFVAVEIPFTPRAKRVLELSREEARQLGHDYIGTEHFLLGLLREGEGVGARVLENLGADPDNIRKQVIQMVNGGSTEAVVDCAGGGSKNSKVPTSGESGTILAKLGEEGKLDLAVGWLQEIDREMQTNVKWHIQFILRAHEEAKRLGRNYIGPEQILLALIGEKSGIAATVFRIMGINLNDARVEVEKIIGRGNGSVAIKLPIPSHAKRILEHSLEAARKLGHNNIGPEHLLLGLLGDGEGRVARVFENLGAAPNDIHALVIQLVGGRNEYVGNCIGGSSTNRKMPTLEEYRTNLTKLVEEGKLDPGAGWVAQIERVMQLTVQWPVKALLLAQDEARWLGHNFVGPEQILLGLIGEGNGIAAKVLISMGINLNDARLEVEKIVGRRGGFMAFEISFTPSAKRVLEHALKESRQLGHNYLGSEHLLLGLLREGECVAARILVNLGADPNNIRTQVIQMIGESAEASKLPKGDK